MKKLFALGLASCCFWPSLCGGSAPAANAQSAGLVSSIFNKMERNRRDLGSHARRHQHGEVQRADSKTATNIRAR